MLCTVSYSFFWIPQLWFPPEVNLTPFFCSLQPYFCPYVLFQKTDNHQLLISGSFFLTHIGAFLLCVAVICKKQNRRHRQGGLGRTQNIMEKWWAFWRYIKHTIHSTSFSPQSSVTHVSVTLFPVAEALHCRAKQWKPGGDWCLIRYGKWTFYRAWLSALFLCQICTDFLQLQVELCILWRRLRCSVPPKWKGGWADSCSVWGWSGWWALLQIATGIDAGFGKRFGQCKDQSIGSKQSNLCFSCSVPGCPLYLTDLEVEGKLDSLSKQEREFLCSLLFYALNWFREVSTALSAGSGVEGWGNPRRVEVGQPGEGKLEGREYCGLLLWSLLPDRKVVLHFQRRGCRISFLGHALYSQFYSSVSWQKGKMQCLQADLENVLANISGQWDFFLLQLFW